MLAKPLIHGLLSQVHDTCFAVTYWDGTTQRYGDGIPRFQLCLHDPGILKALATDVETGFSETYIDGRVDVEGDVADVIATAIRNRNLEGGWAARQLAGAAGMAVRLTGRRSLKQQREDVSRHYDLGNDFFRLYLDDSMTYSCAYFRTPEDTLEQAQRQKIDHSLRKLRLQPGETLLDIGSGWGSLILRAAEHYGVKALGITLSEEQARATEDAIRARRLEDRCAVRLVNYLELAREGRRFDKIVSIGMIEHVGKAHLAEFAYAVREMVVPGGLALLHNITRPFRDDREEQEGFIQRIFPGGYIPAVAELITHYADSGLRILDGENLRDHYRLTLDRWSERYERNIEAVRAKFGEDFARMWRLYLRGCSAGFREGTVELHQFLVSRGLSPTLPLTREDLYAD